MSIYFLYFFIILIMVINLSVIKGFFLIVRYFFIKYHFYNNVICITYFILFEATNLQFSVLIHQVVLIFRQKKKPPQGLLCTRLQLERYFDLFYFFGADHTQIAELFGGEHGLRRIFEHF